MKSERIYEYLEWESEQPGQLFRIAPFHNVNIQGVPTSTHLSLALKVSECRDNAVKSVRRPKLTFNKIVCII
jgi:hypothetical protein